MKMDWPESITNASYDDTQLSSYTREAGDTCHTSHNIWGAQRNLLDQQKPVSVQKVDGSWVTIQVCFEQDAKSDRPAPSQISLHHAP